MKSKCFFKRSIILSVLVLILSLAGCNGINDSDSDAPRTLGEFEDALRGAEGGSRPDDPIDIDFAGNETAWNIYFILAKVGKYVNLDLSASSVTGFDNAVYPAGSGMIISLILPDNLTSIGPGAFMNWVRLTGVTMPSAVSRIGENAFRGCNGLTNVDIPPGLTSIEDYAFSGCSALVGITIPYRVTSIGANAFSSCEGLTSITFEGNGTGIADDSVFPSGANLRAAAGGSGTGLYTPKDGTYKRRNETWWRT
ncbi:MAG: leucine-rich repeat domain-containing protein [Spirochaetaceae bacterium]|jgi:hypothetical protein|nr:leucine-rich repeat domain-containing protein [Spirochaetaceae bacterium]